MSEDTNKTEVIFTSFGRPVLSTLYIDMQLVIQKHQGRTSLSEVLGVLELVKHGLIEGAQMTTSTPHHSASQTSVDRQFQASRSIT